MTYQQAMRKLYTDMQLRGFSERTINSYILRVKKFLAHVTKSNIATLNESDFRSFLTMLHQQGNLKPRTINHYNSIIRFFYEVTLEQNLNYKRVPQSKVHKSRPEALSPDELMILFEEITNLKHFAFFINLYGSGLRISEMVSLKTQDILKSKSLLHVPNGKGGKERFAPLTDAGYWALQQYWKRYRPENTNNYVFPDSTKTRSMSIRAFGSIIQKLSAATSLNKSFSSHTLRHSFATHMLQSGTDLMTLKEMLGHASLSSTAVYLHLSLIDTSTKRSPAEVSAEIQDRYAKRMFFHV